MMKNNLLISLTFLACGCMTGQAAGSIRESSTDGFISAEDGTPYLEYTYLRTLHATNPPLNYHVEFSTDLTAASWSAVPVEEVGRAIVDETFECVTTRVAVAESDCGFLRLKVTARQVGDPGVAFDETRFDPGFPQMAEWTLAGVDGGIPFLTETPVLKILAPTNSSGINAAIGEVASSALLNGGGQILLLNGIYTVDASINMTNHVRLVGQSRDGVVLRITMQTATNPQELANAVSFRYADHAGLDNLTLIGAYGTPDPSLMSNVKPGFMVTSVNFYYSHHCWLDNVAIIDSGNHGISTWRSTHLTFRGCTVDGAWNKGDGGRGYLQIQGSYCLVYNCHIKHLRHLALQKDFTEYNVIYRNFLEQDVNFHNGDNGNNLVEQNYSRIPAYLGAGWHAVMGPWSIQHIPSLQDNYIFLNDCIEYNNGGVASFSDENTVYLGARDYEKNPNTFVTSPVVPSGGTFYPVQAQLINPNPMD